MSLSTRSLSNDQVRPEIEIIQSTSGPATTSGVQSSDSVTTGSPLLGYAAGLAVLLITIGFLLTRDNTPDNTQSQQPETTLANNDPDNPSAGAGSEAGQDGLAGAHATQAGSARRTTITEWDGGQSLIVIENSQFIYEVDLATGRRTSWAPPELLTNTDPLIVGAEVVVIAEDGAWIGKPFEYNWRFLAEADRVMPSSKAGRMWLQSKTIVRNSSDQSISNPYLWTEVDAVGRSYRTFTRERPVDGPSPEISDGPEGAILRLTDSVQLPWRVLSESGTAVATGLNDIVVWECDDEYECERIWYDPTTSRPKTGFFPDLAENVNVRFGSLLSPDGRFVVSRSGEDQSKVAISSVANGRRITNSCVWNEPLVWSNGSQLLACATSAGAELINTDTGESHGLVVAADADWSRMAFIPTARLSPSR